MSSVNYIHDGTGNTYIPPTQRPDGTWRKPIRVRDGYVPQDEQPLYVSRGRQDRTPYPVGLSADDFASSKSSNSTSRSSGQSSAFFEIGNFEPVTKIPGLNFVKDPDEENNKTSSSKKKKKGKHNKPDGGGDDKNTISDTNVTSVLKSTSVGATTSHQSILPTVASTDPIKRLRNVRKKLKDIEILEAKIKSGEVSNPEKEQLEKIQRKVEVLDEIEELNGIIASLNLSA